MSESATSEKAPKRNGKIQSVERAFALLEAIADAGGEISTSELSTRSGLPVPTIHRQLQTLVALGYVRQLPSRWYALGARLVRLGDHASKQLGGIARPELVSLVQDLSETANLAMLDGDHMVYIAQSPSPHAMRMFTEVGRQALLHNSGVGKAVGAFLPEEQVRAILGRTGMPAATPQTLTDIDALATQLATVRARGYAVDEQEQEVGVQCYAVPVPGAPAPMAVSVIGPVSRVAGDFVDVAVPRLKEAAARIGALMS
ncbi:IclR family transcriptional regulator [Ornithinicoccus hortensis]|uniref:Glycerol operon regulatory protein n=1 Tax=Ornithinicoccus hortensis TaxID=82346 RepID=A0A542YTU8_9MICO|nr:IclR family transcriptional regulator [Ornithinicoccus hortensis]TQL51520.1 IclR family transcriptional regulator [Ornithinicoccus hortensis]